MDTALRVAKRTIIIFGYIAVMAGIVVGAIVGIGYLIFWLNQNFHWGVIGVAVMTILAVLLFLSFLKALGEES